MDRTSPDDSEQLGLHHFFEGQMPRKPSARPKHLPFKKTSPASSRKSGKGMKKTSRIGKADTRFVVSARWTNAAAFVRKLQRPKTGKSGFSKMYECLHIRQETPKIETGFSVSARCTNAGALRTECMKNKKEKCLGTWHF